MILKLGWYDTGSCYNTVSQYELALIVEDPVEMLAV